MIGFVAFGSVVMVLSGLSCLFWGLAALCTAIDDGVEGDTTMITFGAVLATFGACLIGTGGLGIGSVMARAAGV